MSAEHLSAIAALVEALGWPLVIVVLVWKLKPAVVEAFRSGRALRVSVGGQEIELGELTAQQSRHVEDLINQTAELSRRLTRLETEGGSSVDAGEIDQALLRGRRILWVDDRPSNNAHLVASLRSQGADVLQVLSTSAALDVLGTERFDALISDIGRPEGDHAGLDMLATLREDAQFSTPTFFFSGTWAARELKTQTVELGAELITSSGTRLMESLQRRLADGL